MMMNDITREHKPISEKQKRGEFNLNTLIDAGIFNETWKKIMFKFYDNEKKYLVFLTYNPFFYPFLL